MLVARKKTDTKQSLIVPFIVKIMIVIEALMHLKIRPAQIRLLGFSILVGSYVSALATKIVITDKISAVSCDSSLIIVALKKNVIYDVSIVHSSTIIELTTLKLLTKINSPFSFSAISMSFYLVNTAFFSPSSITVDGSRSTFSLM